MRGKSNEPASTFHIKQAVLIILILGVGLLLGRLILNSGAVKPEGDGHEGHAEAPADPAHHDAAAEPAEAGAHAQAGKVALTRAQIEVAGITLATAQPARIQRSIQLPGEIDFNQDRTAHVVPRLAGVVEAVSADLGEQVEKGQVLAVVASAELSERRSALRGAQKRLSLAKTTYAREKSLWQEQISPEQDYLQARQALREAQIAVANAKEQLQALDAGIGKSDALSRYEVRAPFAGMVVEKHIALGEMVKADANIFTLSDLSTVWVDIIVPAIAFDVVRVGGRATVQATAFDSSARGTISYVGARVGQQTRAAKARITLANPELLWRPGLFVNVQVIAGELKALVAVKPGAIHALGEQSVVFVRVEDGFIAQPVVTGRSDSQAMEIVAGLKPGARYALDNSFVIKSELGKASASHSH